VERTWNGRAFHVAVTRNGPELIGTDRGTDALPQFYHVIGHITGAPNILLLKHRRSQEVPREGFLEL